jgi:hypothetical protein
MSERMIADMTQCTLEEISKQTAEIIAENQKITSIIFKRVPLTDDDKCFENVVNLVSKSPHLRSLDSKELKNSFRAIFPKCLNLKT